VATLDLAADTVRGESAQASARLAPGSSVLRLELQLRPGDESHVYTAIVSAGGRTVWSEGPLQAEALSGDYVARIWIPRAVLVPGGYTVRLESAGNPIGDYRFTIVP
jgi:hypothetical protein